MDWIEKNLTDEMNVFEYGSGHSTLYLQGRVKRLVSVEHDIRWYDHIKNKIKKADYALLHPEEYPESILNYPKGFDLIIIDGIYRERCARAARQKINQGGYIILDDSEKEKYASIHAMFKDNLHCVLKDQGKKTTIWRF